MRITSYAVKGFRAFENRVELDKPGKVNLIVGPNNVGKTSLLLPLRRLPQPLLTKRHRYQNNASPTTIISCDCAYQA
jgi:predicted ATP-dependent endonuclease of OLD family